MPGGGGAPLQDRHQDQAQGEAQPPVQGMPRSHTNLAAITRGRPTMTYLGRFRVRGEGAWTNVAPITRLGGEK